MSRQSCKKGLCFSSALPCVCLLLDGCVWNQQYRGDSSPLDTVSKYAPDFREKILPTQAMDCSQSEGGQMLAAGHCAQTEG